jgi:integrase
MRCSRAALPAALPDARRRWWPAPWSPPRFNDPHRTARRPAEIARLADAIDQRYRALVLVAAHGGLRIGELSHTTRPFLDLTTPGSSSR